MKESKIMIRKTKIAVIGAGMVGSSFAYAAMIKGLASELVMIDVDKNRQEGEVMDLRHALIGTQTGNVLGGDFKDCQDVDVIVITAGVAQKPGETRLDLIKKNTEIMKSLIKQMGRLREDTVVIIVANPVDIMTKIAQKYISLPKNQVFGSGTSLDTSRLRYNISETVGVDLHNVHGYVLGEHGDSEFVPWSVVNVSGVCITKLLTKKQMADIEKKTMRAAYEIIQRKRATYYGIGVVLTEIVEAVLHDKKIIMPVSTEPGSAYGIKDVCLGIPAVIGRRGVEKVWKVGFSKEEMAKLKHSASILKAYLK